MKFLPLAALLLSVLPFVAKAQGSYIPVAPRPQTAPPCGHYGMKPCESTHETAKVDIPPGASADQIFDLCLKAYPRNKSVAAGYCMRAAEMGHTRAQAALGLDYVHGYGVPQDATKAIFWLTKAADKGHKTAQAQLGDLYEDGPPVPVNYQKAFYYHQLSAAQGWWQGELRLGLDYELGYGTPHNRGSAIQWLQKSMADGKDGLSQDLLTMLRRSDTPAQFANEDAMWNRLGRLRSDAMPKWNGNPHAGTGPCKNHAGQEATPVAGNCPAGYH